MLPDFPRSIAAALDAPDARLKVGMDLVKISRIQKSVDQFGERFLQRVFTPQELAYACSTPSRQTERLAARFAAKEATLKALDLANQGVAWREMEVRRLPDGRCELSLHGRAAQQAAAQGIVQTALTLSHDGDYAAAIVAAVAAPAPDSLID